MVFLSKSYMLITGIVQQYQLFFLMGFKIDTVKAAYPYLRNQVTGMRPVIHR